MLASRRNRGRRLPGSAARALASPRGPGASGIALGLALLLGAAPAVAQTGLAPPLAPPLAEDPGLPPAQAPASLNPFSQTGVPAEATAENGVLARERALAAGRRTAWARLSAELGLANPPAVSDSQLEAMVSSIVIEQERVSPTRYTGRITVNFNPSRARSAGARAAAAAPSEGSAAAIAAPDGEPARPTGPASTWLDAVATYRSMEEWLELQRRLRTAGTVASVQVQAIAVDRARVRLGLRSPGPVAAGELAGMGVALVPTAPVQGLADSWRVGLAGGG